MNQTTHNLLAHVVPAQPLRQMYEMVQVVPEQNVSCTDESTKPPAPRTGMSFVVLSKLDGPDRGFRCTRAAPLPADGAGCLHRADLVRRARRR